MAAALYEEAMAAIRQLPADAVVRVCILANISDRETIFLHGVLHNANSFTSQTPPKPSARHVGRMLHQMGFRSVRAVKKPLISLVNRKKRLAFARRYRNFDFGHVIFSDEKSFRVRPGGHVRCWKLVGLSKFEAQYTVPTVQRVESVMVWAAMKSNGAISLRRCPPKVKAADYQTILQSAVSFIRPRCDQSQYEHLCKIFFQSALTYTL